MKALKTCLKRKHNGFKDAAVLREHGKMVAALTDEVVIKYAEPEHIPSVIEINRLELPENYPPSFFMDLLERFPNYFLVAVLTKTGEVIGYVMCRIETGFPSEGGFNIVRKGHVVSLAVKRQFHGRGIGKTLMNTVLNEMVRNSIDESFLEVRVNNEKAIRLYKSLGYHVVREIPHYYLDGTSGLLMVKKLR
ncbi:MAG: GNAT family N-acetyltransferase [Thaumarchaeota archaeon]|jgi:ribosomal-protein-alanine N-acetyltransferase|nr:GNAT family N-acetyltransferase [Nitrososphaerota archaeon]